MTPSSCLSSSLKKHSGVKPSCLLWSSTCSLGIRMQGFGCYFFFILKEQDKQYTPVTPSPITWRHLKRNLLIVRSLSATQSSFSQTCVCDWSVRAIIYVVSFPLQHAHIYPTYTLFTRVQSDTSFHWPSPSTRVITICFYCAVLKLSCLRGLTERGCVSVASRTLDQETVGA